MENRQTETEKYVEKEKYTEEKPPVLSSWNQLYLIVFINLAVLIVLFYLFTKLFS